MSKFKNEILAKIDELDYELKERLINSLLKEYKHISFVSDALIALK
ncbi:hypothetical protein [Deferribacter desulfuricans]|nr:hypothetical protein [Deferribacter desulfuricans]